MIRLILSIIIIFCTAGYAQERQSFNGEIKGRVIDANSSHSIEYANIVLYKEIDSSQVTGTISNPDGYFLIEKVPPGKYYVDILFMGYERERMSGLQLNRNNNSIDLGEIQIEPASINLGDVIVEQDRPSLTYQIDKKVLNVDQLGSTISGNAADVLENIPSVSVDIEGNVSLRGSTSFTVLIDGRSTVVDPQDVLQQIPASTIEDIEIITNPSVKYNPEGTAGIINIILKKNRNAGISGIINGNAGLKNKYGGDLLLEYKTSAFNTTFGVDYNDRSFPGTDEGENRYMYEGNNTIITSSGNTERGRKMFGLRGAVDFNISENNFITLGGRLTDRKMNRDAELFYNRWTDSSGLNIPSINNTYRERKGNSYNLNLGYVKRFEAKGHELSADLVYSRQNSSEYTFNEIITSGQIADGTITTEDGPSKEWNARIDYVLPVGSAGRIEAGFQGEIDIADEVTQFNTFNIQTGIYEFRPLFSHDIRFEENEAALYSTYAGELNAFGYKLGLRGEYTNRLVGLINTGEDFTINRWDYFPSIHTSYRFSPAQQVMASYTRRINRPGGWALEPFVTWFNANTLRQGNPALLPEFIDSYELGAQTYAGKMSISAEVYYIFTNNKIEGVRSVIGVDTTLQTFANVGTDYSLGTELMFNFGLAEFWDVSLMGNLYDYRIEGFLYDQPFSRNSFNWRGRLNNVIKIASATQLQFNVMYNSPSVSSQGRRESYVSSDAAVRQDFLDKKLSLILQVRDLFGSTLHEFTSEGPGFYSFTSMRGDSPVVMLNVRLNINNFKQERPQRNEEGFMEGDEL